MGLKQLPWLCVSAPPFPDGGSQDAQSHIQAPSRVTARVRALAPLSSGLMCIVVLATWLEQRD